MRYTCQNELIFNGGVTPEIDGLPRQHPAYTLPAVITAGRLWGKDTSERYVLHQFGASIVGRATTKLRSAGVEDAWGLTLN